MTASGSPPYPVDEPDQSVGDLVGKLTSDFGSLVQSHIQLAKEEIVTELKQAGRGAGLVGGAALAGWIALLLVSFAAAWGLSELFESVWLGFLVVGLVWAVTAAALFINGRGTLQELEPLPRRTMNELEEDKKWLTEQTN
jgi:uncharacterized membrane protein YqjE